MEGRSSSRRRALPVHASSLLYGWRHGRKGHTRYDGQGDGEDGNQRRGPDRARRRLKAAQGSAKGKLTEQQDKAPSSSEQFLAKFILPVNFPQDRTHGSSASGKKGNRHRRQSRH